MSRRFRPRCRACHRFLRHSPDEVDQEWGELTGKWAKVTILHVRCRSCGTWNQL
jgi:hypothetical protein